MTNLTLTLGFEESTYKKDGKEEVVKNQDGSIQYIQHDGMGLMNLLGRFDTKKYQLREYRSWITIKNKCRRAVLDEQKEIVFTEDETKFLKTFLTDLSDTSGKSKDERGLQEFEVRTLINVLDQINN